MDFTRLEKCLDSFLDLGIPGVSCEVYYQGKPVFKHMNGYADLETKKPITEDTLFTIASCTKVITVVGALMLYEQGKFLLDDPLSNYMPEFKDMKVRMQSTGIPIPAEHHIRIQDLFTMSAGLPMANDAMQRCAEATDGRCPTREAMKYLAQMPLDFEPGTLWAYGICHDVLGALIEVLSGMTFGEYLKKNIFDPLGMNDTTFHPTAEMEKRIATRYDYDWETKSVKISTSSLLRSRGTEYESGGGGLTSSVRDYAKFANALISGKLISQATIDLMRTPFLSEAQLELFRKSREPGVRKANERAGYSYGLGVRTMVDKAQGGSNGPVGEFGWAGALGAYTILDTENQVALFYAQQTLAPPAEYTRSRLRNVLYSCIG